MIRPALLSAILGSALLLGLFWTTAGSRAQDAARFGDSGAARTALDAARSEAARARQRAEAFDEQAAAADTAARKAQAEAAALAARIQQAEAAIQVASAQLALVQRERRSLDLALAQKRRPIVRLTGALQTLVRRPVSLGLLSPASLRETVYLGAVLDSTVPLVRERTSRLRGELERASLLQGEASDALAMRRSNEEALKQRRAELAALARRENLAARDASNAASREEQRALALAERARDIDGLVGELEELGALRDELAALPGPVLRPADPSASRRVAEPTPTPSSTAPPAGYRLPVTGRVTTGFGARTATGTVSRGLTIIPRESAQIIAPAKGRVAFAGPYRGFGQIVIIEHANGWTSLVTGLEVLDTRVGQEVVAGSPLGLASARDPQVTLETRREGESRNPLDLVG